MQKKILNLIKILVIINLLIQLIRGNFTNFLICLLTFILLLLADIIQKYLKYNDNLKILIYIFFTGTYILGEVYSLYAKISYFDLIMHSLSGFIIAAIAPYIAKLFSTKINKTLLTIFAFSFSLSIGALWELTEFTIDRVLKMDMQKDTVLTEVTSSMFSEDNKNPVTKEINNMTVNNIDFIKEYGGYIDIGLYDTIEDMFMCLIGTVLYIIYFRIKTKSETT